MNAVVNGVGDASSNKRRDGNTTEMTHARFELFR